MGKNGLRFENVQSNPKGDTIFYILPVVVHKIAQLVYTATINGFL